MALIHRSIHLVFLACIVSVMVSYLIPRDAHAAPANSKAERGRYLVESFGCSDCHTPMRFDAKTGMPVPDRSRFLAGHPAGAPEPGTLPEGAAMVTGATGTSFRLPFGVVYAANLTPDQTGLAGWTEEMFVKAMRGGRHMGGTGRPIYPPMPWTSLRNMTESDLGAIFAWLKTIPAVRNEVPEVRVAARGEGAVIRMNTAIAGE